jgi:hypothetical protein
MMFFLLMKILPLPSTNDNPHPEVDNRNPLADPPEHFEDVGYLQEVQ